MPELGLTPILPHRDENDGKRKNYNGQDQWLNLVSSDKNLFLILDWKQAFVVERSGNFVNCNHVVDNGSLNEDLRGN